MKIFWSYNVHHSQPKPQDPNINDNCDTQWCHQPLLALISLPCIPIHQCLRCNQSSHCWYTYQTCVVSAFMALISLTGIINWKAASIALITGQITPLLKSGEIKRTLWYSKSNGIKIWGSCKQWIIW